MNHKKIEALYHENKDFLFHKFLRFTQDPDQAYDLVQSVFLRLIDYSQRREFSTINKSFLVKVGYNIFVSEYHKKNKDAKRDISYSLSVEPEDDKTPEAEYSDLSDLVNHSIDNLRVSERIKIALRMRLFGEEGIDSISELNQVSNRTTIRDLKQGLALLKEALQDKR